MSSFSRRESASIQWPIGRVETERRVGWTLGGVVLTLSAGGTNFDRLPCALL